MICFLGSQVPKYTNNTNYTSTTVCVHNIVHHWYIVPWWDVFATGNLSSPTVFLMYLGCAIAAGHIVTKGVCLRLLHKGVITIQRIALSSTNVQLKCRWSYGANGSPRPMVPYGWNPSKLSQIEYDISINDLYKTFNAENGEYRFKWSSSPGMRVILLLIFKECDHQFTKLVSVNHRRLYVTSSIAIFF